METTVAAGQLQVVTKIKTTIIQEVVDIAEIEGVAITQQEGIEGVRVHE